MSTDTQKREIWKLHETGLGQRKIAARLGMTRDAVRWALKTMDGKPEPEPEHSLPGEHTDSVEPYIFDGNGHGLVLSDIHIPYHDRLTIKAAVADGKKHGVNHVILNGDTMDFYQCSRFTRSGKLATVCEERQMTVEFLCWLREQFPKARIIVKIGNHEDRFEKYIQTNAKELEGLEELELGNLLHLDDIGAELVAENQFIYYGHLTILHAHEFRITISNPVNPARGAFLRAKACTLVAHHHQSSMHSEPDIRGRLTTCWSTGCCCQLRPKYMPVNKWNNGYALVEKSGQSFQVTDRRIVDGELY